MKRASWGYCVSVFDSSAGLPVFGGSGVPGGSRTEFEFGRTTSCDEGAIIPITPPKEVLELISEKHVEAFHSVL